MSHFSVLVIGDDVEQQLQPFHEFECTGIDDKYVIDIDRTEEVRADYNRNYAGPVALGHSPDPVEVARHFAAYAVDEGYALLRPGQDRGDKHKYGFAEINDSGEVVRVVKRTNPNKRWDWWVMGGRWGEMLRLKAGRRGARRIPGTSGIGPDGVWRRTEDSIDRAAVGSVDSALKGDVDFDAMRMSHLKRELAWFDAVTSIIDGRDFETFREIFNRLDNPHPERRQVAREIYQTQPVIRDLLAATKAQDKDASTPPDQLRILPFEGDLRDMACNFDRGAFVEREAKQAIMTFAVVKDGQWRERGTMGWFASVSDAKSFEAWADEFFALLNSTPDDVRLTVVDCHI